MTDYQALIDNETWTFIEQTLACYPPGQADNSIARRRETYDRMCRAFFSPYPDGVSAESKHVSVKGHPLHIRRYRAMRYDPHAVVLYYHGGGFTFGSLESHDDICAEICSRTGYEVVSVDYRLAPEHRHPAAFDDALAFFEWAADAYDLPIVLAGDSAGGNLAAVVSHRSRGHRKAPIGQMLIYPALGGDESRGSYVAHAHAPLLSLRDIHFYKDVRSGGSDFSRDPTYMPLTDTDYAGLPPTIAITAQCDPLSSDGETYCSRIVAAHGKGWWHEETGLVHGFLRARHIAPRARDGFTRIVDGIRSLGRKEWSHPLMAPEVVSSARAYPQIAVHSVD
ncbi:alpha/beta hydrolase [Rhizobium sp. KVB221]|uniref:Alpha/beta hydrolase n=1 Tax=Rhizobium setariae TaxID=2801340 RepID=A0A937CPN6_9HYPH|nr:alpha/beta hydrolase [Rhizobium setariae]MBL0375126.1 alpha/beta hydrolase [Rhizobium setariae]